MVGNHGPFCCGKSASQSVFNSTVLEEIAKMAFLTEQINPNAEKLKKTFARSSPLSPSRGSGRGVRRKMSVMQNFVIVR